jgi:hypothetical protein
MTELSKRDIFDQIGDILGRTSDFDPQLDIEELEDGRFSVNVAKTGRIDITGHGQTVRFVGMGLDLPMPGLHSAALAAVSLYFARLTAVNLAFPTTLDPVGAFIQNVLEVSA